MLNGAVYLESALRNINSWQSCWGESFDIVIVNSVTPSNIGREWFTAIQNNKNSILQEESLWQLLGITRFALQWQNYKTIGLHDTIIVSTALGYSYPLSLSSYQQECTLSSRHHSRCIGHLQAFCGLSARIALILFTPIQHKFCICKCDELLYQNSTMVAPLTSVFIAVHNALGPFNSVDMKYIVCTMPLVEAYGNVIAAFSTIMRVNTAAQSELISLPVQSSILPFGSKDNITSYSAGGKFYVATIYQLTQQ
ncbi:hypothetical protein THRCLA_05241 [Thraustotheca clavata]|uniref:Uncharacterized protein n=1 Tax=Thraustotheca clavata TaxID=74557 RepID=A0A1V9ZWJ0_9STRA|nr:hypothetical protein THRCLA_05241 [Thraustotheca clavata]